MTSKQALAIGTATIALLLGASPAAAQFVGNSTTASDADATPDEQSQDIVVTGARAGEIKALAAKHQANNLVEALYANDVGKLPDQNVAEALRRLPGLSVANDQGEGRYVIIRGINPNLVNVVLNGLTLPAPEPDGRQVKLDDIPSALINGIIVSKSLTADQDANAIGGEVNIQTLSAFDRNKPYFADARVAYGGYAINSKHPYEADAQAGAIFGNDGQFGAVVSVNYSSRPIESQNYQGSTNWRIPAATTGANQNYVLPDANGLRDYNLVRQRAGVVLNLDWRPTDATRMFVRGTYSRFDDNETRDQFIIDNQSAFTNQTATTGTFRGRGSVRVRRRDEADNTRSVQFGGSHEFAGGVKLDAAAAWTRAQKRDPLRSEYNFRTGGTALTVNYDVSNTPYFFTPTVRPTDNQTAYGFNSVTYDTRNAVETLWQGRADLTVPVAIGDDGTIQFGGKYLDRHKTNERDFLTYGLAAGRTFTLASVSYPGNVNFYDGAYVLGPRIGYDTAQSFLAANPGTIVLNAAGSLNNSLANDYDVAERIGAGYAMATLKFGRLTLIPGVRIEHTEDHAKAKTITAASTRDQAFNAFSDTRYTDIFPGLNARFDATSRFVIRAAATTAIGRPNYPDLSPYVSVDLTTTPRPTVVRGNPALDPYRAVNLDLAAEYYLPGDGLVSVGLFYKHLDNPIYTQTQINIAGTYAGQTFAAVDVTQPLNIDKAIVRGIEANVQTRFTFLPSPFDGFGVAANYARITGHGNGTIQGATPRTGDIPLFLQSRDVASAQIFYEKYGIAIRAAYSYRSPYLDTLGATAALDQYTDRNGQLDLNGSYQVTPQLTFFAQATNLTDAPWRRYIGNRTQLVERERYDYSVRWGVQLHF